MNNETAIYGLFSKGGKCVYVGKTRSISTRNLTHKRTKNFDEFKVLKWVSEKDAGRIEFNTIWKYRRLGQASLNKYPPLHKTVYTPRNVNSSRQILKSVQIRAVIHKKIKVYCASQGCPIGFFLETVAMKHIEKGEK